MNKEEFDKILENVYRRVCLHQAMNEPISHDLDNLIRLVLVCEKLENRINKAINKLKELDKQVQNDLCKENYMGGARTKNLINELKDILKEGKE